MENTSAWLRPRTTRRYIHPPKAERMYTIWAEGKILFGEVVKNIDWRSFKTLECSGLWLLHGEDDQQLDFHNAKNTIPENGTPIHGLSHSVDAIGIDIETFCDIDRKPTCFIRITFTNNGTEAVQHPFSLLLRSGKEKLLAFASPDVYASYAPDVNVWKEAPATWYRPEKQDSMVVVDENTFLIADSALPLTWDEKAGALRFDVSLAAGETAVLTLSLGKGDILPFDYDQEKQRTITFWERELSRLTKLPEAIKNDPALLKMVQNLTVHLLQCCCYQVGSDYLLSRQGGLQRLIWPWEAISALEALSRIGDFSDYIEPVLSMYFEMLQAPDGEIRPAGEGWACITASVLYSFALYCRECNTRFYYRYRKHAMAAFDWIKRTRATSVTANGCFAGLFPPMRGCDWGQEFQAWMSTDIINVDCLAMFSSVADQFGDPRAEEIRAEYLDYHGTMCKLMEKFEKEAEGTDQLRVPLCPDGNDAQLLKEFYPYFNFGKFSAARVVKDEDVERMLNFTKAKGIYCDKGLYGHMPYEDGNLHIWYTSIPDYYWFLTWMRLGNRERAEEIINAQINYSMTDEYYMLERYADNDPYYVPWSPNSSANGRTIIMLIDFYS
ncbi:MAG: hypothetical protein E7487_02945 [Ruminococcaceae bacterium]|nr:hypothetical protein [Oscillospiraceae bacterium]